MLERLGEGVEFVRTHVQCAAGAAPCRYRALDFANDTARSGSGETAVGGNRHQGIDGCIGAAVFGNPGLELARARGEWIEIESGRESPADRQGEHTSELQLRMGIANDVVLLKKK